MPTLYVGDIPAIRALNTSTPMPVSHADRGVITSERKIPGPTGAPEILVRLYRGVEHGDGLPGIAYFHPGLTFGTLEMDHARCMRFAAGIGCVVVSVDYRLAPENPYPAGVEDCYAALCWLAANAAEIGVDAERLAVVGASTGATLAAAVALMARDRGGPKLAYQMLIQPCVDDRLDTPSMAEFNEPGPCEAGREGTAQTWQYYLAGTEPTPYAAPARAESLAGLPPSYVSTAERDCLRDEGIAYGLRLLRDGVPTELHHYPGTFHAFDLVVRTAVVSQRAVDEQIAVLTRALARPRETES